MISGTLLDMNSKPIVGAIISLHSLVNGINTFIAFTYTDISSSSSPFNFKNIDLSRVKFYIRNNGIEYNFI